MSASRRGGICDQKAGWAGSGLAGTLSPDWLRKTTVISTPTPATTSHRCAPRWVDLAVPLGRGRSPLAVGVPIGAGGGPLQRWAVHWFGGVPIGAVAVPIAGGCGPDSGGCVISVTTVVSVLWFSSRGVSLVSSDVSAAFDRSRMAHTVTSAASSFRVHRQDDAAGHESHATPSHGGAGHRRVVMVVCAVPRAAVLPVHMMGKQAPPLGSLWGRWCIVIVCRSPVVVACQSMHWSPWLGLRVPTERGRWPLLRHPDE